MSATDTAAGPQDSKPCDRCVRGTYAGPNGRYWRCGFCHGTGRVVVDVQLAAADADPRGRGDGLGR